MKRDGVTAYQHELDAIVSELDEQIAKVLGQLDHFARRGAKDTGICSREYLGNGRPAAVQLSRVNCSTSDTASGPETGTGSGSMPPSVARLRIAVRRLWSARVRRSESLDMGQFYHAAARGRALAAASATCDSRW